MVQDTISEAGKSWRQRTAMGFALVAVMAWGVSMLIPAVTIPAFHHDDGRPISEPYTALGIQAAIVTAFATSSAFMNASFTGLPFLNWTAANLLMLVTPLLACSARQRVLRVAVALILLLAGGIALSTFPRDHDYRLHAGFYLWIASLGLAGVTLIAVSIRFRRRVDRAGQKEVGHAVE